jgi:hypothetical protein
MKPPLALAAAFAVVLSGAAASAQTTVPAPEAPTMPGATTPENGSSDIQFPGAAMPGPANSTTPGGPVGGAGPGSSGTGGIGSSH